MIYLKDERWRTLPVSAKLMAGRLETAFGLRTTAPQHLKQGELHLSGRGQYAGALKRLFDIMGAVLAILFLLPLLLMVAASIRLETPGPIFFSQLRFGEGGRMFYIWKFRSMHADRGDATGAQRTTAWDSRVTRIGRLIRRTSIDELPQLVNVLVGDMSLVGPRPHATHMQVEGVLFHELVPQYHLRHTVRPGITGWAQINGSRGEVDTAEKAFHRVALDLWYVSHWSILTDLRILFLTVSGGFLSRRAD